MTSVCQSGCKCSNCNCNGVAEGDEDDHYDATGLHSPAIEEHATELPAAPIEEHQTGVNHTEVHAAAIGDNQLGVHVTEGASAAGVFGSQIEVTTVASQPASSAAEEGHQTVAAVEEHQIVAGDLTSKSGVAASNIIWNERRAGLRPLNAESVVDQVRKHTRELNTFIRAYSMEGVGRGRGGRGLQGVGVGEI